MYADLLRLAVEKPHLRQGSSLKRDDEKEVEYHTYAYMVWNFIEAVYDRIFDDTNSDENLRATWDPVISVEYKLFGDWFNENSIMFKHRLKPFIDEKVRELKIQHQACSVEKL